MTLQATYMRNVSLFASPFFYLCLFFVVVVAVVAVFKFELASAQLCSERASERALCDIQVHSCDRSERAGKLARSADAAALT